MSKLLTEVCQRTATMGHQPTGNAYVEPLHKTLEDIIACYVTDDHRTWPALVLVALWAVRSAISTRTKFSPYNLLFGREPVSMGLSPLSYETTYSLDDDVFFDVRESLNLMFSISGTVEEKYNEKLRQRLDRTTRPSDIVPGDLVYTFDPTAAENQISKFSKKYKGPYRVIECISDNLLRLQSLMTGCELPHLYNINKVKRAFMPWCPTTAPIPNPLESEEPAMGQEDTICLMTSGQSPDTACHRGGSCPSATLPTQSDNRLATGESPLLTPTGPQTARGGEGPDGLMTRANPISERHDTGDPRDPPGTIPQSGVEVAPPSGQLKPTARGCHGPRYPTS